MILHWTSDQLRCAALFVAMALYALWGVPTPDHPGIVEIMIGALLVCAVGVSGMYSIVRFDRANPLWRSALQILVIYGLSAPLLSGIIYGHDPALILRDILPFLFLGLPLFAADIFKGRPQHFQRLLWGCVALGAVFSLRASLEIYQDILGFLWVLSPPRDELTYLANAPTLLFCVLFLIGFFAQKMLQHLSVRTFVFAALVGVGVAALCVPLVATMQRASIAYIVLYILILMAVGVWRYPYRTVPLVVLLFCAVLPFMDVAHDIVRMVQHKTGLVGLNMRLEELSAAWAELAGHPLKMMFGSGWGASFESPAVGGVRVNFTHSLLSSALLKMGIFGLGLVGLYIYGLGRALLPYLQTRPVLVLALAGPIAIDTILYAAFKSLDFGLVLLLGAALTQQPLNVASRGAVRYE